MISTDTFRQLSLSFPEVTEQPHFEKTSFRIGKKIFATLNIEHNRACIKLSEIDQDVFCTFDRSVIFPVPNKWGKQGWTLINLKTVRKSMLLDALNTAYCEVAPAKLVLLIKEKLQPKKYRKKRLCNNLTTASKLPHAQV